MRNARHADDAAPLDPQCDCPACTRHSRAYIHHLIKAEEMLGPMLLTWHNIRYYQRLMQRMRDAILAGRLAEESAAIRAGWAAA
jgi:queuine tRNA-ribosyltransferase